MLDGVLGINGGNNGAREKICQTYWVQVLGIASRVENDDSHDTNSINVQD